MLSLIVRFIFILFIGVIAVSCKQSDTKNTQLLANKEPQVQIQKTTSLQYSEQHNREQEVLMLDEPYGGEKGIIADWVDLIPKDELAILLNPPEYLADIVDGTAEDQLEGKLKNTTNINSSSLTAYEKALISTNIIEALDELTISIPGFVVPLETNESQVVTQFFFVPYFGACMHLPPPPPNQIIHVSIEQGIKINDLYEPIWVTGKLSTTFTENDVATSAYSMTLFAIKSYEEYEE
jgi:hypothetical protein